MVQLVLVLHNIRSAHNVGSILRSADGLGVHKVYMSGYTPYPMAPDDSRLPHDALKVSQRISKTSLGAEKHVAWQYSPTASRLFDQLQSSGYTLCALEQTATAVDIMNFSPPSKMALVLGSEIGGVEEDILRMCTTHLMIPMRGRKDSFNVAVAAALAVHQLRLGRLS